MPDTNPAEPAAERGPLPSDLAPYLDTLREVERHLYAHRYAKKTLDVLGPTIDPAAVTADRGEALAVLEEEDHELVCSPELKGALDHLSEHDAELDETTRAQVRVLRRAQEEMTLVPAADQAELTRLTCEANDVWTRAKHADDWASFEPYVDRLVALMRRMAHERDPRRDAYDVWLDHFEQGTSRAFYDDFFARVKDTVVPLLMDIRSKGYQPSRDCIEGRFDVARQWQLARDVAELEGVNLDAWWLTETEHPFSEAMTTNYAVTAAHVYENDVTRNLYSMLHEGGHNSYEQGVDPSFNYTSLSGGTSAGMHEGQSRFFENYVGRDRAFAPRLLEVMARHFRGQLGRVTPNQFYLATNRAEGQPIRTEADELTYPLHILVRYEIEQALFSGEAKAADVPTLWRKKYHDYLGVEVKDDTHGALQDSHWSDGLLGYFPTYALGGAFGAQLRHQMIVEGMDWDAVLGSGDLAPIREWLRDRVWQWGRAKDSGQIIQDACGEPFSARYYVEYLDEKFSDIYGLR